MWTFQTQWPLPFDQKWRTSKRKFDTREEAATAMATWMAVSAENDVIMTCRLAEMIEDDDVDDRVGCENCDARPTIEEAVRHFDIYLCPKCDIECREFMAACEHVWEEGAVSPDGDKGRVCHKCSMFEIEAEG